MIGMLLTAVLSSSAGQQPPANPMENNPNVSNPTGAHILNTDAPCGGACPAGQGPAGLQTPMYPPSPTQNYSNCARGRCNLGDHFYAINEPGAIGLGFQGNPPACNRGSYCALLGTYIGGYPTAAVCPSGAPVAAQACGGYGGGSCPGGYGMPAMGGYNMGMGMPMNPMMGGMGMNPMMGGMGMGGMGMGGMGMGGMGMGGFPGGSSVSFGPPIILPPGYSLVYNDAKDCKESGSGKEEPRQAVKEHKAIKGTLDEIKGTLDRDVKGTLEKLLESLRQTERRLEATEKTTLSTEERVKWIQEEIKQQKFWHDMENRLDQRIKPLEHQLHDLHKKLDVHDHNLRRHDDKQSRGFEDMERRETQKPTQPTVDDKIFKSIESKLDRLQGSVMKDISSVLTNMEELRQMMNEEKLLRQKMEDRLKALEKGTLPKDEPKDKELQKEKDKVPPPIDKEAPGEKEPSRDKEAAGLPKVRVAQVSRAQEGVPANKAIVIVTVPADAKLYLDNRLSRSQGTQRTFVTPPLEPGGTYTYSFRMEVVQNGAIRTQTQNVTFQAGRRVNVNFGPANEVRVAGHRQQ